MDKISAEEYAALLDRVLERTTSSILSEMGSQKLGSLYSAGVDSALLAKLCQDAGYRPLLLSLGTERSKDREFVERSKEFWDLPVRFLTISDDDIKRSLSPVRGLLQEANVDPNLMQLSLAIGTYLLCQMAQEEGIEVLLSAQGADALFAGFFKYRKVPLENLPSVLEQDVKNALNNDFVRDKAIAASFSMKFFAPFLSPQVVEVGLKIPADLKLRSRVNKYILREVAKRRGLPDLIVTRPKKAMQYSTGIQKVVRALFDSS